MSDELKQSLGQTDEQLASHIYLDWTIVNKEDK